MDNRKQQPKLSRWQIWNISFGFLGVQFGFALQNSNVSRILSDLGADLHSLSLFWLAAPLMGLFVQPLLGAASDKTWNRLGRRKPYILFGAVVAAIGMMLMPNAPIVAGLMSPVIFAGVMLALMDGAFNVTTQPFRSLVADMVPSEQRNLGYSMQSGLINIGAVAGSLTPFVLTNIVGLDNVAKDGQVASSVIWTFYLGAATLLGSVLWTVYRAREYPPATYYAYKGINAECVSKKLAQKQTLAVKWKKLWELLVNMPNTMKQLAVVQFFSWFAFFIMWVYTLPAITQHIWGIDTKWFDSHYIESVGGVPESIAIAKGAAGDWVGIIFAGYSLFAAIFSVVLTRIANRLGRKLTYSLSLLAGGLGYISFLLFQNSDIVHLNLLITEINVPIGALYLLFPMVGVGIAWAAILAMPYAILSEALPANKTGIYMGIFNFSIAAPQIVSGLIAGQILRFVFDNHAINIIVLAGVFMLIGAASVYFIKEESIQ